MGDPLVDPRRVRTVRVRSVRRVLPGLVAATLAGAVAVTAGAVVPSAAAEPGTTHGSDAGHANQGGAGESSGQPYAPHWFPEQLLDWDPDDDPDAAFNRSHTALRPRVQDEDTGANPDGAARQVMALSVFGNTSGNPSQGSDEFDAYLSEFWPYLDTLVFWGGSADEGLILAPNPTVTDAAHRNGVPVLGTVFLPPEAFGGDLEWTRQLLQRDQDGNFPVADKLIEAAEYYGFDGWFVNAETEGADPELASEMHAFLQALSDGADETNRANQTERANETDRANEAGRSGGTENSDELQVLWYDSMVESGEIAWQDALNERNDDFFAASDLMFLNYWWDEEKLADSADHAAELGRDPADLFAGIDVGAQQFDIQEEMDTLYPSAEQDDGLSVGLYRPDFTLTGTDDPETYAQRERRFWVGADGDPSTSTPDEDGFTGMSSDVWEHTPVTRTPFTTFFGTGRGTAWFHDGQRWQTGDWNDLSAQDVLPTWRFLVQGPDAEEISVDYEYDRAWRGGSSLRLNGTLGDEVRVPLFASRLDVTADTEIAFTTRIAPGPNVEQELLLWFDGASEPEVVPFDSTEPAGNGAGKQAGWRTHTASLEDEQGRTLTRIGVRMSTSDDQTVDLDALLGGLQVTEGTGTPPAAPSDVRVEPGPDGDARVFWSAPDEASNDSGGSSTESNVERYQVEAVAPNGDRTWLGTTTAQAAYARDVPDNTDRIEVVGLDETGTRGDPGSAPVQRSSSPR